MEILESHTVGTFILNTPPHNDAQRIYFTPPSTRRYRVTQILLYLYRTEEATTPGVSRAFVHIQRAGQQGYPIAVADLPGTEVGASRCVNLTTDITLRPGDYLRVYTSDTSTDGKISYWLTVNYDAIP